MSERERELLRQARCNVGAALTAHKRGELGLRDVLLRSAADRYRATGNAELAQICAAKLGGDSWDRG
jgi:hypothetical protein